MKQWLEDPSAAASYVHAAGSRYGVVRQQPVIVKPFYVHTTSTSAHYTLQVAPIIREQVAASKQERY